MKEIFVDSLLDSVFDSLKVLPILFLAYLLVSLLSHDHSHKFSRILTKKSKTGPLYGAFLGCVPQCGFSTVIAELYSHSAVTLGTLIAVFVATSDEAIPIMVSTPDKIVDMLILIAIKVVLAIFWGYMIDLIFHIVKRKKNVPVQVDNTEHTDEEHFHEHHHECGHIHSAECSDDCGMEHGKCCVNNVFLDAFLHTFSIAIYVFVATFLLSLIYGCVEVYGGENAIKSLLDTNVYLQIVIAGLIGLFPNCASSVLLVQAYIGTQFQGQTVQLLSFPALLAGLTAGAGVGLVILFAKNKKRTLSNVAILILQYAIGIVSGLICLWIMMALKIPV